MSQDIVVHLMSNHMVHPTHVPVLMFKACWFGGQLSVIYL